MRGSGPAEAPDSPELLRRLGAVVIAGGRSRRMGAWKAALPWVEGRPLAEAHLAALASVAGGGVVCALPEERREEAAARLDLTAATAGVAWIADSDAPPFASYLAGLRTLLANDDDDDSARPLAGAWLTPVDAPPASPETLRAMLRAAAANPEALAVRPRAFDAEAGRVRLGHPALLRREALDALMRLDPNEGRLDLFLRALPPGRQAFAERADSLVLANLNRPDAYERALTQAQAAAAAKDSGSGE